MSTVYFTTGISINMVSGELTRRGLAKIQLQNHSHDGLRNGGGGEFLRDRKLTIYMYRCMLFLSVPLCGSPIMSDQSVKCPSIRRSDWPCNITSTCPEHILFSL